MDKQYRRPADFLLDDTFIDYCLGTDAGAKEYWKLWQLKHPDLQPVFGEAVELFHTLNTTDLTEKTAWNKFEQTLQQYTAVDSRSIPALQPKPKSYARIYFAAAACVAGIIILGFIFRFMIADRQLSTPIAYQVKADTIRTAKGQQKKIILPDSSTVVLNYNSTLIIPSQFSKGNTRQVELSGEAIFYAKKDPQKPFIVQSGLLKTTVLGTVFNVEAYAAGKQIAVTVLEGKVGVAAGKDSVTLLPDRQAIYHSEADSLETNSTDAASLLAWQQGKLCFRNKTLEQISFALGNKFNTTIQFRQDKIRDELFTASFEKDMPLEAIAEVLCTNRDLRFSIQNNTLWFSKK